MGRGGGGGRGGALSRGISLLLQPGGLVGPRGPQLDVELVQRLLQLLLVAGKVRRDGVVEEEELLVHDLHLEDRRRHEATRQHRTKALTFALWASQSSATALQRRTRPYLRRHSHANDLKAPKRHAL